MRDPGRETYQVAGIVSDRCSRHHDSRLPRIDRAEPERAFQVRSWLVGSGATRLVSPQANLIQHPSGRNRARPLREREALVAHMYRLKSFEANVVHRYLHRTGQSWFHCSLHIEPTQPASYVDKRIDLVARVGSPLVASVILQPQCLDQAPDHDALPRRADLRVPVQRRPRRDSFEMTEYSGITDIDPRRFDQVFLEIRALSLQRPCHESRFQDSQIPPYRVVRDTERSAEFRSVPRLTAVRLEHGPESVERRTREIDASVRNVPIQIGADEVGSPLVAIFLALRCERTSAAAPLRRVRSRSV